MKNRGQQVFGMSFGVIFSIILIIFIIGTGFFVIRHFISLSKCTQIGGFYQEIEDKIDEARGSGIVVSNLGDVSELPKGLDKVCFGSLTGGSRVADRNTQNEIKNYVYEQNKNLFLYPPEKACDGSLFSFEVKYIQVEEFFCVDKESLESVKINKGVSDSLVRVSVE